jgi:hypothetical protein
MSLRLVTVIWYTWTAPRTIVSKDSQSLLFSFIAFILAVNYQVNKSITLTMPIVTEDEHG